MSENKNFMYFMTLNNIGTAILKDTLYNASFLFGNSSGLNKSRAFSKSTIREAHQSLAFIQGTGLELMIEYYHLGYNPDNIRKTFFTIFNQKDRING